MYPTVYPILYIREEQGEEAEQEQRRAEEERRRREAQRARIEQGICSAGELIPLQVSFNPFANQCPGLVEKPLFGTFTM